jgi:hypothetical protein
MGVILPPNKPKALPVLEFRAFTLTAERIVLGVVRLSDSAIFHQMHPPDRYTT